MTTPPPALDPPLNPTGDDGLTSEEARAFELLDAYVQSLHSGDLGSRSVLLERNPDLLKWMRCLELLDRLAPQSDPKQSDPTLATHSPSVGRTFGKYELDREVGRGGMGVVFRARQTDLDRVVAIKMILSSRLASDDVVQRFYAEARAAARLRHPNIVAIHEVGEIDGQHFFAMDFVEGRSLAQALAEGPFEPSRAAQCVAAIARAVQYLHEHDVVHRDLKPSNILLSDDDAPLVTDFGLAKAWGVDSPHTQTGAIVGTPGYMAPEQAAGELDQISPRSDVYSLGAILFELLTGRPPFQNPNPIDTLLEVIEGQPPKPTRLNPRVPPPMDWICLKCLERDPHKRYASAAALADDLERFQRRENLSVGPPGVIRSLVRWSRQEPALASHLGALAVSAVIVQVKYMISGIDRPLHLQVMWLFTAWAGIVFLWHGLLRRNPTAMVLRYLWAASDAIFLTLMLYIVDDPLGPLLIGYPLLIVAAGLFYRVRLVSFMTGACIISYGLLIALGHEARIPPHYPLIFSAALAVIGLVVGYQAHRVRVLTRYCEDRRRSFES